VNDPQEIASHPVGHHGVIRKAEDNLPIPGLGMMMTSIEAIIMAAMAERDHVQDLPTEIESTIQEITTRSATGTMAIDLITIIIVVVMDTVVAGAIEAEADLQFATHQETITQVNPGNARDVMKVKADHVIAISETVVTDSKSLY